MSKKIILFLSDYKPGATERTYLCPGGESVTGAQTNDAPVKYLLRKYPDVDELLCIVTPEARESALEPFTEMVKAAAPDPRVTDISFSEGQDFSSEVLGKIIAAMPPEKDIEILLETTGGFRNAIMHLLLVSRAMSFIGISTKEAVYSNFKTSQVEDVSHLVDLFDFVGGMQEMSSFGSVQVLREYYQEHREPEIEALLSAMERLKEDISLCRTGKLDQRIAAFNSAIEQAGTCADPLFRALLPAFRGKFGKRLTIPGLIKWCVNNDMVQQALTIYKELVPGYLLERNPPLLTVKQDAAPPAIKKEYETEAEARFRTQLLTLSMLKDPEKHFHKSDFLLASRVSYFKLQDILMDYAYIRMLRNRINHASEQETNYQTQLAELLGASPGKYKNPDQVSVADVKKAMLNGLERLKV